MVPAKLLLLKIIESTLPFSTVTPYQPVIGPISHKESVFFQPGPFVLLKISTRAKESPVSTWAMIFEGKHKSAMQLIKMTKIIFIWALVSM